MADPDRARNFRARQAAYIHGNASTYVQVAPTGAPRSRSRPHPAAPDATELIPDVPGEEPPAAGRAVGSGGAAARG